jgi:hypothetical protein
MANKTIESVATTRRRRSKFPNQENPQEHWNLRNNSDEEEIEIPKSRNSSRTLESAQQQRGGGDRNSQIKKFLKNTLFGWMTGWMTRRMTVRVDSKVASFLIPKQFKMESGVVSFLIPKSFHI